MCGQRPLAWLGTGMATRPARSATCGLPMMPVFSRRHMSPSHLTLRCVFTVAVFLVFFVLRRWDSLDEEDDLWCFFFFLSPCFLLDFFLLETFFPALFLSAPSLSHLENLKVLVTLVDFVDFRPRERRLPRELDETEESLDELELLEDELELLRLTLRLLLCFLLCLPWLTMR